MEKYIGQITHYFNKAGVIVVNLKSKIAVGDMIKVERGESEFKQEIGSMQIEHESVDKAKDGDEVAIKVKEPAKEGDYVYKVED